MNRDDRPTPVEPREPFRPARHDPRREPDRVAMKGARLANSEKPQPAAPAPQESADAPSVPPQVDLAIGRAVRAILAKLWPALLAGALGTGGAIAARPEAPAARVDAHGVRLGELEKAIAAERDERKAREAHQLTVNAAVACRLRVLASAAKRQSYDPGFAEDVFWLSVMLEPKPKGPPIWRAAESCPALPEPR